MKKILFFISIFILANYANSQITTNYSLSDALISDNTRCFAEDNNGNIWIGSSAGISIFDGTDFSYFTTGDGLGGNVIYDFLVSSNGNVYAATSGGLSKYNGVSWMNYDAGSGLPSTTIWCVDEDIDGKIWVGTSSNGAAYFDGVNWHVLSENQGLISNSIKCLFADRNGNIWFGTANGLSVYDGIKFKNFNSTNGLAGNLVNEITQLDNGNIAIATNGGVGIYNFHSWNNITTQQGLPTANILTIAQDNSQNIWVGTALGLTKIFGSTFTTYDNTHGLSNKIVNKILITKEDNNSQIWVGSPFNGLTVFDMNQDFVIYRMNKNIVGNNISTIFTDENNTIWIGTNDGLNKVLDRNWRTFKVSDGLVNNMITAIHKDQNQNVWIGTQNGLSKISGQTIVNFNTPNLSNSYINDITSDNTGKVYVATRSKVNVIEDDEVVNIIDVDQGLANDTIKKIHFENGRIWFLSDAAIQYFDGSNYIDATALCAGNYSQAGAVCSNTSNIQYFGDDYSLRIYDVNNTTYNCIPHPYSGVSKIVSMTKIGNKIYCVFENGELQYYDGTWTNVALTFSATWVEHYLDENYILLGSENQGLFKLCLNCSSDIVTTNNPPCLEGNNGSITITSPSGSQYSINNGNTWQASNTFSNLKRGYKHILIKNSLNKIIADKEIYLESYNGHIGSSNLTITQIDCFGNNSGEISLDYDPSASHVWENYNTTLLVRENLNPGTYSVTITDGASCTKVLTNSIVQPEQLVTSHTYNNITCYGLANGSIDLTIEGGTQPYSILWSNGDTNEDINNLMPTTYIYTVTDANNCTSSNSQQITQPNQLEVSADIVNNLCHGDTNGSIDITISGGTTPYDITWSNTDYVNAQNDIVNAPADTYTLNIVDQNNCSIEETYTITEPEGILLSLDNLEHVKCYGENTGKIIIDVSGGYGALSFEWKKDSETEVFSTEQNIENLFAGTYHLSITDANNCQRTETYTVSQSPALSASINVTPITCAGSNDGQMSASATGGSGTYSAYTWYNSEDQIIGVNQTINNLGAGDYYVVVRDSYYCYATAYASLTQATPHVYETSHTDMTCNGLNNGTITITIDGGSGAGFNFNWQSGVSSTTNTASNLGPGTYFVTVTDPTNCVEILEETIIEPPMQSIGCFDDYGYVCYGNSLTLNPGNFVSYIWSTGEITQSIDVENEGTYFVEVVDNQGCHLGDTIQLVVNAVYNNEEINLASVDNQGSVTLMWNKTPNHGTEYFKIYKDIGNGYDFLTNVYFNQPAIYTDTDVDTENHYYKYKISVVDSCGAESQLSEHHRTCLLSGVGDNNGASWLNWGAYEGFFVVYYFIERGSTPNNLEVVDSVLYNQFNWAEMNPNPDGSYYRIKVRRMDGCNPGDGNYYSEAYSNIVFCNNNVGFVNNAIVSPQVYPNPFKDEINIEFYQNIPGEVSYSITNMLGQTVESSDKIYFNQGNNTLKFNTELQNGVYILKLNFREESHSFRIIKN